MTIEQQVQQAAERCEHDGTMSLTSAGLLCHGCGEYLTKPAVCATDSKGDRNNG